MPLLGASLLHAQMPAKRAKPVLVWYCTTRAWLCYSHGRVSTWEDSHPAREEGAARANNRALLAESFYFGYFI